MRSMAFYAGWQQKDRDTIEISTIGFTQNICDFTKAVQIANMPDDVKRSIVRTVVNASLASI